MALARIITRFPEESRELEENLRSRGFEVRTESPEGTSEQPADLEITMEECGADEALRRATAVKDACAFVMPGAIAGEVRPIAAIPFIPQASVQQNERIRSEARTVDAEMENFPRYGFGAQASRAEVAEVTATPIGDLESLPSVNEDVSAMISEPEHATVETQYISQGEQPEVISAMVSEPTGLQTEGKTVAPESHMVVDLPEPGRNPVAAVGEISNVPAIEPLIAESLQARQHSAEELEPVSPSAGPPELNNESVVEVSAASDSGSLAEEEFRLQEPIREQLPSVGAPPISDWPIWQPISAEDAECQTTSSARKAQAFAYRARTPDSAVLPLLTPRSQRGDRKSALLSHPIFSNEKVFWRTATLAGVVALFLVLVMSAHRLSPLPAALQQRSGDLRTPETKPAVIVPADLSTVTRQSRAPSRARAAKPADSVTTRPATAASKVNLASSRHPVISSATNSAKDDTDIAQDTVVRYGSQSSSPAPTQKAPAKRYADLN